MKKSYLFVCIFVAILLMLTSVQVLAAPLPVRTSSVSPVKKTPQVKPQTQPEQNSDETSDDGPNGKANGQGHGKGKVQHYQGTVSGKSASSITLTLADGSSKTISVNSETKIKIPGVKDATLDTIQTGSRVNVQVRGADAQGNPVARMVMAIPGKPAKAHHVGTVTAYGNGSITIQGKDGTTTTYTVNADTKILPKGATVAQGATVTIIAPRNPAGGALVAKGIVVHGSGEDSESD